MGDRLAKAVFLIEAAEALSCMDKQDLFAVKGCLLVE